MTIPSQSGPVLGELYHVGLAVRNVEESIEKLTQLGVTKWGPVWDFKMPARYKDHEGFPGLKASFAFAGPIMLELVAPTDGDSPVSAYIDEFGEGLEHLGYRVDDVGMAIERAKKVGMKVEWEISDRVGLAVAYMSGDALFGMHVELVRSDPVIHVLEWLRT